MRQEVIGNTAIGRDPEQLLHGSLRFVYVTAQDVGNRDRRQSFNTVRLVAQGFFSPRRCFQVATRAKMRVRSPGFRERGT